MNVLDALALMVRNFPGGLDVVSVRLGKARSTLEKELRNAPGFKLGALDADAITALCVQAQSPQALAYINVVAANAGGHIELLGDGAAIAGSTHRRVGEVAREFADVVSSVTEAAEDGSISLNDLRRIEKEYSELLTAGQGLLRHLHGLYEAQRPMADTVVPLRQSPTASSNGS